MTDEQKFRTSIFGGFDKKNVVQYITKMMDEFDKKIDLLKKEYEDKIEKSNAVISDYEAKCKVFVVQIENLKNKVVRNEHNYQEVVEEKIKLIDAQQNVICRMNKQINNMKNEIEKLREEDEKIEDKVQRAETDAKNRVNKIVSRAKKKIEKEYRENVERADNEGRFLRKSAREEASRILKNAADRAYQTTMEAKEETKRLVEAAQAKADGIVAVAHIVVEKMLKNGAREVIEGLESRKLGDVDVDFDVDVLKEKIDKEVLDAIDKICSKNHKDYGMIDRCRKLKIPLSDSDREFIGKFEKKNKKDKKDKRNLDDIVTTKDKS